MYPPFFWLARLVGNEGMKLFCGYDGDASFPHSLWVGPAIFCVNFKYIYILIFWYLKWSIIPQYLSMITHHFFVWNLYKSIYPTHSIAIQNKSDISSFKIILVKWRFSKGNTIISGKSRLVKCYLGGGFKYCLFSPLFGEMIQFD